MKISSKQYANSLYEAIHELKQPQVRVALNNFIQVLTKNNDLSRSSSIILEFEKVWNERQGIIEAEVTSASKLDKSIISLLEKYIKELYKAKKVEINNLVDKQVLAGVIIKIGDQIIDNSFKTKIKELKKELIK